MDPSVVLPPVPVVGISPVVQWLLACASIVVSAALPVLLAFLHAKFSADARKDNNDAIRTAVTNGAKLGAKTGNDEAHAVAIALDYARAAVPDAIAATPQATDMHLTNIATAVMPPLNKGSSP